MGGWRQLILILGLIEGGGIGKEGFGFYGTKGAELGGILRILGVETYCL